MYVFVNKYVFNLFLKTAREREYNNVNTALFYKYNNVNIEPSPIFAYK